ncbi:MAG: hypothetical protein FWF84_03760, partial [Kiritimatiellaeota bacterium]|nr:hypothetical protein [Kiritimatiellota bacterium]
MKKYMRQLCMAAMMAVGLSASAGITDVWPDGADWWMRSPQPLEGSAGAAIPWPMANPTAVALNAAGYPTSSDPEDQWKFTGFSQTTDRNFVRGTATIDENACIMRSPLLQGIGGVYFQFYTSNAGVPVTCTVQTSGNGISGWTTVDTYTTAASTAGTAQSVSCPVGIDTPVYCRLLLSRGTATGTYYGFIGHIVLSPPAANVVMTESTPPDPPYPGVGQDVTLTVNVDEVPGLPAGLQATNATVSLLWSMNGEAPTEVPMVYTGSAAPFGSYTNAVGPLAEGFVTYAYKVDFGGYCYASGESQNYAWLLGNDVRTNTMVTPSVDDFRRLDVSMNPFWPDVETRWWIRKPFPLEGSGGSAFPWPEAVPLSGAHPVSSNAVEQWTFVGSVTSTDIAVEGTLTSGSPQCSVMTPPLEGIGTVYADFSVNAGSEAQCTIQISSDGFAWETVDTFVTQKTAGNPEKIALAVDAYSQVYCRFLLEYTGNSVGTTVASVGKIVVSPAAANAVLYEAASPGLRVAGSVTNVDFTVAVAEIPGAPEYSKITAGTVSLAYSVNGGAMQTVAMALASGSAPFGTYTASIAPGSGMIAYAYKLEFDGYAYFGEDKNYAWLMKDDLQVNSMGQPSTAALWRYNVPGPRPVFPGNADWYIRQPLPLDGIGASAFPWPTSTALAGGYPSADGAEQWDFSGDAVSSQLEVQGTLSDLSEQVIIRSPLLDGLGTVYFAWDVNAGSEVQCTIETSLTGQGGWSTVDVVTTQGSGTVAQKVNAYTDVYCRLTFERTINSSTATTFTVSDIVMSPAPADVILREDTLPSPFYPTPGAAVTFSVDLSHIPGGLDYCKIAAPVAVTLVWCMNDGALAYTPMPRTGGETPAPFGTHTATVTLPSAVEGTLHYAYTVSFGGHAYTPSGVHAHNPSEENEDVWLVLNAAESDTLVHTDATPSVDTFKALIVSTHPYWPDVGTNWWLRAPQPLEGTAATAFPWPLANPTAVALNAPGYPVGSISEEQWQFTGFSQTTDGNYVRGTATTVANMGACVMRSPYLNGIGSVYFRMYGTVGVSITYTVEISPTGYVGTWEKVGEYTTTASSVGTAQQVSCPVNRYEGLYCRIVVTRPADVTTTANGFIGYLVVSPPPVMVELTTTQIPNPGYPVINGDVTFHVDVAQKMPAYNYYWARNVEPKLVWEIDGMTGRETTPMEYVDGATPGGAGRYAVTIHPTLAGELRWYIRVDYQGYYYPEDKPRYPAYIVADEENRNIQQNTNLPVDNPFVLNVASPIYRDFKRDLGVRLYPSPYGSVFFSYTNTLEAGTIRLPGQRSPMTLVGTNTWQVVDNFTNTQFAVTNGYFEAMARYISGDDDYDSERMDCWGDPDQAKVTPAFASQLAIDALPIRMEMNEPSMVLFRADFDKGGYDVRRAAYQDFNQWQASDYYFEESYGLYGVQYFHSYPSNLTYTAFLPFVTHFDIEPVVADSVAGDFIVHGWGFSGATIIEERVRASDPDALMEPQPTRNRALKIAINETASSYGYIHNLLGNTASLRDGLEAVSLRHRVSFGDGQNAYYSRGFGWDNYGFHVTNLVMSSASPGNPSISIYGYYMDADNNYELRVTQSVDAGNLSNHQIHMQIIKNVNGVATQLASRQSASGNSWVLTNSAWNLSLTLDNGSGASVAVNATV